MKNTLVFFFHNDIIKINQQIKAKNLYYGGEKV